MLSHHCFYWHLNAAMKEPYQFFKIACRKEVLGTLSTTVKLRPTLYFILIPNVSYFIVCVSIFVENMHLCMHT